jgi:hypothetical protein
VSGQLPGADLPWRSGNFRLCANFCREHVQQDGLPLLLSSLRGGLEVKRIGASACAGFVGWMHSLNEYRADPAGFAVAYLYR